jgi:hypothetical protein
VSVVVAAILFSEAFSSLPGVDTPTVEQQDVPERTAELTVKADIDYRVEKAIGIAKPEKETVEPGRYQVRGPRQGLDEGHNEERQPAGDEGSHDDAEGARGLTLADQSRPSAESGGTGKPRAKTEPRRGCTGPAAGRVL